MPDIIHQKQLPELSPFEILCYEGPADRLFTQPHRNEHYEIVWVVQGQGCQNIDFVDHEVGPGRIFTMTPNQVHAGSGYYEKVVVIKFMGSVFDTAYRNQLLIDKVFYPGNSLGSIIEIDSKASQHLLSLVSIMLHEQNKDATDWDLQEALLNSFVRYLSHFCTTEQREERLDPRVIQLMIAIEKHFRENREADFYSSQLSLTNKRINELTRKQLNKTITQLVHDRIILEARRELVFGNQSIKSISFGLGFPDSSYFCRFFRRQTGESPMAFRNSTFK